MTPPSAERSHHPGPRLTADAPATDLAAAAEDDHPVHVTPAYVESPELAIPRAPLGHALDPHLELDSQDSPMTTSVHAATGHATPTVDHAAMDHSGMAHDMSDPAMAAAMERDMRNRFFVALLLTIPIVLYSPLGRDLFGLDLPIVRCQMTG